MPIQFAIADCAEATPSMGSVWQRGLRSGNCGASANLPSPAFSADAQLTTKTPCGPVRNIFDRLLIPLAVQRVSSLVRMSGKAIDAAFPALGVARAGQNTVALVKAGAKRILSVLPAGTREKAVRHIKRELRAFKTALLPNDPRGDVIATLPCVIRRPGRYRLVSNLVYGEASGAAIEISANRVTIDLQGHTLRNTAGPATCATGIGGSNVADAAIINGAVSGFRYGILLRAGKRHHVEKMRAENNWQWGISVEGRDCDLRDNVIMNTGGSTAPCSKVCIAMRAFGARQTVAGNVISGVRRSAANTEWVGIHFDSAPNSRLENNLITAAVREPLTWGIWLNGGRCGNAGGTDVFVSRNSFVNLHTAATFADHAAGTCADNVFINLVESFVVSGPEGRMRNQGGNVHYLRVRVR